jgi:hypothetical protein
MKPGYHLFVDSDGEILAFYAVYNDSADEPWRPMTYRTLPEAIAGGINGSFSLFLLDLLPLFIHTKRN